MMYFVKVKEQGGQISFFCFSSPSEARQKMEWRKAEILEGWWNDPSKPGYVNIIDMTGGMV
jgi:hypothetical protein